MKFLKPKFWDQRQISLFSILLFPFVIIVKLIAFIKNFFVKKNTFSIPIICVGNIYLGGTGKTPISIEIFNILKNLNRNPAFIRKKYKSFEDEIVMQKQIGTVLEDKKRSEAIKSAIKNNNDVAILDDGFQDLSIKKNLSIVCFNEKQWIGNGLVIPSGPLREELSGLNRADCVLINGEKNEHIEQKILSKNEKIKIFYFKYFPININKFKNKKIICFAGIGNPINFFNLLKKNNINILEEKSFPDHYFYTKFDLNHLSKKAIENNAELLTTKKDYLRINKEMRKNINFLEIKVEIQSQNEFVELIKKTI